MLRLPFISFSQYLQRLLKSVFVFTAFSCSPVGNLTASCLAGTMPESFQSLPQWLEGFWILNIEYPAPFHVLPSEPMLLDPPQYLGSHPIAPTICIFFHSDIYLIPLTSDPAHDHRSLRIRRDKIICRKMHQVIEPWGRGPHSSPHANSFHTVAPFPHNIHPPPFESLEQQSDHLKVGCDLPKI